MHPENLSASAMKGLSFALRYLPIYDGGTCARLKIMSWLKFNNIFSVMHRTPHCGLSTCLNQVSRGTESVYCSKFTKMDFDRIKQHLRFRSGRTTRNMSKRFPTRELEKEAPTAPRLTQQPTKITTSTTPTLKTQRPPRVAANTQNQVQSNMPPTPQFTPQHLGILILPQNVV